VCRGTDLPKTRSYVTPPYASSRRETREESENILGTKTTPTTYGYARVSTREQNLDRQLDALREFGVDERHILQDKASGKDFDRPAWKRLVARLRTGDVLVVKSIDRLGRDYDDIVCQWRHVTKDIGADIVVLDMPLLDTRGPEKAVTGTLILKLPHFR
jgi:DNA invertase Pin-like site-specific DNA recombinase